jgi:hypothetical protein
MSAVGEIGLCGKVSTGSSMVEFQKNSSNFSPTPTHTAERENFAGLDAWMRLT